MLSVHTPPPTSDTGGATASQPGPHAPLAHRFQNVSTCLRAPPPPHAPLESVSCQETAAHRPAQLGPELSGDRTRTAVGSLLQSGSWGLSPSSVFAGIQQVIKARADGTQGAR